MSTARLIAIDWGTSSLRAWLMGDAGAVLESRRTKQGIMQVADGDFESVYRDLIGDWIAEHGELPVIACGMIGSRGGWAEAAYADCSADLADFAKHLLPVAARPVPLHIVPGVIQRSGPDRLADVMRGEETQVLGAAPELADEGWLVLPGTHCKWVTIRDGCLTHFATYMTGELFAVLCEQSILGRPVGDSATDSPEAFILGVDTARDAGSAGMAATLFSARSRLLAGEIEADAVRDYLSGLLIGDELRSVLARREAIPPLCLVGDAALCARYRRAMARFAMDEAAEIADAARDGLWRIAESAALLTV